MAVAELGQWLTDNQRLLSVALEDGDTPIDSNKHAADALRQRCVERYGEDLGEKYYQDLILTYPDLHKKNFREIFG